MAAIRSRRTGAWVGIRVVFSSAGGLQIFAGLAECSRMPCPVALCAPLAKTISDPHTTDAACATSQPSPTVPALTQKSPHREVPPVFGVRAGVPAASAGARLPPQGTQQQAQPGPRLVPKVGELDC